jgi:glutamate synthase (NADPH/NADH) small chain
MLLTNPTKILGTNSIEGIECVKMALAEPDASGRRRPMPENGSEFVIACDQVIVAIGQGPNPLLLKDSNLKVEKGYLVVNEMLQTSDKLVFAGGDIIGGNATVIKAMADGKTAAKHINAFLTQIQ